MARSGTTRPKPAPVMRPTGEPVAAFLASLPERRRGEAERLCVLLGDVSGEPPPMWARGTVGFGEYHYRYDSGHEGDAPLVSFAPRVRQLVLYLAAGLDERYPALLDRLGKHRAGKGCLYLTRLDDADPAVLRELVQRSVRVHRGIGQASGRS